jgi:hypothetical protein
MGDAANSIYLGVLTGDTFLPTITQIDLEQRLECRLRLK